jgi:mannosylglycerate hydrolase
VSRRIAIVPHTHWDREWYLPFQTFRLRLVRLLDELLARLDTDPSYAHFLLDGQMAVVDDYLAIRPEAEATIRRLAHDGRLAMGPWYILMDEFLVSGETMIRNLQKGLDRAEAFGGAMEVGYLPDMFGHVAQMPQILRLFGFEHAVVWRGVPSQIDRSAFWWSAPDGSTVRAEYLPTGYGNGANLPDDAAALIERIDGWIAAHADQLGDHDVLWMNGSDHLIPQAFLGRVVEQANAKAGDRYQLDVTSLASYLASAPTADLATWHGEMRSGARANLLMGVTSNRTDVRVAAGKAERSLEQLAEPLLSLHLPASEWPTALLNEAWTQMIRNSAHDSICACSHDEVVAAVLHRFHEARQIGEGLAQYAADCLAATVSSSGPLAVNPSARTRSGVVDVTVTTAERERTVLFDLPASSAVAVFGEMISWTTGMGNVEMALADDGNIDVVVLMDDSPGTQQATSLVTARLAKLCAARPTATVRAVKQEFVRTVVPTYVRDVPGFGWAPAAAAVVEPVTLSSNGLSNGLVTVTMSPDGTFAINGRPGFGGLVDGGDAGDTYNYSPPITDKTVTGWSGGHTVTVSESSPARSSWRIEGMMRIAESCDARGTRRIGERQLHVVIAVELRAGERFVRTSFTIDNQSDDHRLRIHFPLLTPSSASHAECAFTVVERGLIGEGGPTERAMGTYPARRFVQAGGLTVAHEGVTEYELVDVRDGAAHELALTLIRATGYLSRGPMTYRPLPAGPIDRLRGSQMRGAHTFRFAISVEPDANGYALADDAFTPLLLTNAAALGSAPARGTGLSVTGAEVSAVQRRAGRIEVRLFNPANVPTVARIEGHRGQVVDLRGRSLEAFDETITLNPHQIVTISLNDISLDPV